MIQLKIENNIVIKIYCGSKDPELLEVPDYNIISIGHDIRYFSDDYKSFLTVEQLVEKGIIIQRRFLYEPFYKFLIRELNYTEPKQKSETNLVPPVYEVGFIPVFGNGQWEIKEDKFWIPQTAEINYNSGRSLETLDFYSFIHFDAFHLKNFPNIDNVPLIFNSQIAFLQLSKKISYIHNEMYSLKFNFENRHHNPRYDYKNVLETIAFHMKWVIDMLVQLSSILISHNYIVENHKLKVDSLGMILNKPERYEESKIILGDNEKYQVDQTNFLKIINSLFNSFKHCLIHTQSYMYFGIDVPTVLTYYAHQNDFNKLIEFHNHNAYHLIMGFQDTIVRIQSNMVYYKNENCA